MISGREKEKKIKPMKQPAKALHQKNKPNI